MASIELKFPAGRARRMLMQLAGIRRTYVCPQTWNELTSDQVLFVARHIFSKEDYYVALMRIASKLSGVPLIANAFMDDANRYFLAQQVEWVFDYAKVSLTKNPASSYGCLHGPADNMSNIIVDEFLFADPLFTQYITTRNENTLNHLVAVLYRKKARRPTAADDVREDFDSHSIEARVEHIAKWPDVVKLSIFLFYHGWRNMMAQENPDLFGGSGSGGAENDLGFYNVVSDLAAKFGTVQDARRARFSDFKLEWKKAAAKK